MWTTLNDNNHLRVGGITAPTHMQAITYTHEQTTTWLTSSRCVRLDLEIVRSRVKTRQQGTPVIWICAAEGTVSLSVHHFQR